MSEALIRNGTLVRSNSVSHSVLGRGFAFGFGVFETIKFLERQPCFFKQHLARLNRAIAGAELGPSLDEEVLREDLERLFEANEVSEGVFKIVVSDDDGGRQVTVFIRSRGLAQAVSPCRLVQSCVRKASRAFTSRHKTLNYMESVLELEKACERGFDECVFRNEFGFLTECAIANLFFVSQGVLKTPHLDCGLLDGIVRDAVLRLAGSRGLKIEEGAFEVEALLSAEEAFITSSGAGLRPVREFVDERGKSAVYGSELIDDLRAAYLELERAELR